MDRKSFLKTLLSGGIFTVLQPKSLHHPPHSAARRITIYEGYLKGIWYYDGEKVLPHLPDGTPLELRPEPQNAYDQLAIEVFYKNFKLGYVGREDNHKIYHLLAEKDLQLEAVLDNNGEFGSKTRLLNEEYSTWFFKVHLVLPNV